MNRSINYDSDRFLSLDISINKTISLVSSQSFVSLPPISLTLTPPWLPSVNPPPPRGLMILTATRQRPGHGHEEDSRRNHHQEGLRRKEGRTNLSINLYLNVNQIHLIWLSCIPCPCIPVTPPALLLLPLLVLIAATAAAAAVEKSKGVL